MTAKKHKDNECRTWNRWNTETSTLSNVFWRGWIATHIAIVAVVCTVRVKHGQSTIYLIFSCECVSLNFIFLSVLSFCWGNTFFLSNFNFSLPLLFTTWLFPKRIIIMIIFIIVSSKCFNTHLLQWLLPKWNDIYVGIYKKERALPRLERKFYGISSGARRNSRNTKKTYGQITVHMFWLGRMLLNHSESKQSYKHAWIWCWFDSGATFSKWIDAVGINIFNVSRTTWTVCLNRLSVYCYNCWKSNTYIHNEVNRWKNQP